MGEALQKFLTRDAWLEQVVRMKALPADTCLRKGLVGGGPLVRKAIDVENRVVALVVSTSVEDRSHDIVTQSGWELDDFRAIPTILFGHDHWSFPIGKGIDISVVGERLVCLAQFPTREVSPEADTAFNLMVFGALKGVSAGFKPLEWTWDDERGGMNYLRQLLLEASMVPVPDNQTCMALKGARAAGIDLAPWKIHAEKALDTKAAADLQDFFSTLYTLGGSTMKGKTIRTGALLAAALQKATTDAAPRATLVKAMAEKAGVDIAGMETILKGEAEDVPSLDALAGVAGVVAASVDEVLAAAAADVTPETPAAPPAEPAKSAGDPPPAAPAAAAAVETPAPAKAAHDPATCTDEECMDPSHGMKAVVAASNKNTKAVEENSALLKQVLAKLSEKPTTTTTPAPTPPETKAAATDEDDELDLEAIGGVAGLKAIIAEGVTEVVNAGVTSLTGRLTH